MSSQGSFVPRGKNDILTAAIGTPEHPGRCRGAGKGVGLKKYFGGVQRSSSSNSELNKEAFIKQVLEGVEVLVEDKVTKLLAERSQSCGGCQNTTVHVPTPMTTVGSKGSCSPSNVEEEEEEKQEETCQDNVGAPKTCVLCLLQRDHRHGFW